MQRANVVVCGAVLTEVELSVIRSFHELFRRDWDGQEGDKFKFELGMKQIDELGVPKLKLCQPDGKVQMITLRDVRIERFILDEIIATLPQDDTLQVAREVRARRSMRCEFGNCLVQSASTTDSQTILTTFVWMDESVQIATMRIRNHKLVTADRMGEMR